MPEAHYPMVSLMKLGRLPLKHALAALRTEYHQTFASADPFGYDSEPA